MPWAKLDDQIWKNPKLLGVLPASRWLYIACIAYCRSEETGGELTRSQMAFLVGGQALKPAHVTALVTAGLLDDIDLGYAVHDYEKFNPLTSAERMRRLRAKTPPVEAYVTPDVTLSVTPDVTDAERHPSRVIAPARRDIPEPGTRNPVEGDLSPKQQLVSTDPALPLIVAVGELWGRTLSEDPDKKRIALWPVAYVRLSPPEIIEIVRDTIAKYAARGKVIHSLALFEGPLKTANERKADMAAPGTAPRRWGLESIAGSTLKVFNG